jgi:hypothetical protein
MTTVYRLHHEAQSVTSLRYSDFSLKSANGGSPLARKRQCNSMYDYIREVLPSLPIIRGDYELPIRCSLETSNSGNYS